MAQVSFTALEGLPRVQPGQDLVPLILSAAEASGHAFMDGDIVVLAQKIVSKSENRYVDVATVQPSELAHELAEIAQKDPRLVELILSESQKVLRCVPGVLIVRHRIGVVAANAGIDQSNLPQQGSGMSEPALLLPLDPDASARVLCDRLSAETGRRLAVLIIDSIGRAWRQGTCGTTIGAAGIECVRDLRGQSDYFGRTLLTSELGIADEIAAGASLVMGQAAEGRPVVLVRGLEWTDSPQTARHLQRPRDKDLFQ
ncbi:coenzyme F420-0:L-glutamate ligase [Alcaligenaceae bacterium]|nr:coenzyme F420-0:L-glutamate ligase [Alcaligenaceae bacterium]